MILFVCTMRVIATCFRVSLSVTEMSGNSTVHESGLSSLYICSYSVACRFSEFFFLNLRCAVLNLFCLAAADIERSFHLASRRRC